MHITLKDLKEDWIYTNNYRLANYTDVPPGNYIFHVKGSNNDDYWNETGTSLAITILPPPWKTWWAYMLYGIVILGIVFVVIRFYLKRLATVTHGLNGTGREAENKRTGQHEIPVLRQYLARIPYPADLILGPLEKLRSIFQTKMEQMI